MKNLLIISFVFVLVGFGCKKDQTVCIHPGMSIFHS